MDNNIRNWLNGRKLSMEVFFQDSDRSDKLRFLDGGAKECRRKLIGEFLNIEKK